MSREEKKPRFVAIVGPTASGKSSLALHLARAFQGEILSADSMQVYRRLNIGTAKPSPDEQANVRHHLIDILDPDEGYSAALFRKQAEEVIRDLHFKSIPIFLVGGTGLYLKVLTRGLFRGPSRNPVLRLALVKKAEELGTRVLFEELKKLDPEAAARIHPEDQMRLIRALEVYSLSQKTISQFHREHGFSESPFSVLKIGIFWERSVLFKKIDARVKEMLGLGWVEEVRSLLDSGYPGDLKSLQSLGYRQIVHFLRGESTLEEAVQAIQQETRRYAKRQMTWFKTDPEINWFAGEGSCLPVIEKRVAEFFRGISRGN
jgi:tRNA dimethylallyltransferase